MATSRTTGSSRAGADQGDSDEAPSRTTKIAILALLAVLLIAGIGAIVAAVGLFGSDDETIKSDDASSATADSLDVDSKTDNSTANDSDSSAGDSDGVAGSTGSGTSSGIDGADAASGGLQGAATTPVSVPFPAQDAAMLKDVRVAAQDGFDRVVFEFDGPVPGYIVQYVPGPLTEDPSDKPVSIKGDKFLLVTMNPASGVSLAGDSYEQIYTGASRMDGPGSPVQEVVRTGDFEAVLSWAIGVDGSTGGERPFKVSTLDSPNRLVIDIAH